MSEFKFACPVCGQHITVDSQVSGSRLECPTCFQKIVVPQAPASGDSKLILSGSHATKPPPTAFGSNADLSRSRRRRNRISFTSIAVALVLLALAGSAWVFRRPLFDRLKEPGSSLTNGISDNSASGPDWPAIPLPTNVSWSMDFAAMAIPDAPVVGSLRGFGFRCDRASLQGGELSLEQGNAGTLEQGIRISLFAQEAVQLTGKTVNIAPGRAPPLPKITLVWLEHNQHLAAKEFSGGYALKLTFGRPINGRMSGKVFVSLPDEARSFVAGTFDAEMRKP